MADFGALKVLVGVLTTNLAGFGVNVAFGEEDIIAQDVPTPMVCVVPNTGTYDIETPGYAKDQDPERDAGWSLQQLIDVYVWGYDDTPGALAIDHVNVTENLRARVLQSLWMQRAEGLSFWPISERWALMENAVNRYGRALVITVRCNISVLNVEIEEADVTSVPVTVSIAS